MRVALTIAATDSGGGAGVGADLKTFEAHGVWGTAAVTAVTAQDTAAVHGVWPLPGPAVRAQIEAVVRDIGVHAAKTGMLATADVVEAVAAAVGDLGVGPLVVDPVLVSSSGHALVDDPAALADLLVPLATVVTPNLAEAAALAGASPGDVSDRAGAEEAARAIAARGARVVMVTGGHLDGDGEVAADLVLEAGGRPTWLEGPRVTGTDAHGSGCVLSAALAAELARGMEPADACVAAKQFAAKAIASAARLGRGAGPADPGWERAV